ncbi:MAG: DUF4167 domain-containing protein [Roseovarius sp.]
MRSSKSRSRNKSNRNNRTMGNVVNRVFDSSGPEGKVRGTPQQIIDKYNQLARDAQLAGDRVAAENFQQHAEHYLRMLGAAQKEQDAKREEQERHNRERQAERDRERAKRQERELNGGELVDEGAIPDVMETQGDDEGSGLVETPESQSGKSRKGSESAPEAASEQVEPAKPEKPKRPRKPRSKPKGDADGSGDGGDGGGSGSQEAAE